MNTNKKEIGATKKETGKINLISDKEYTDRYKLSGNTLNKSDIKERLKTFPNVNGSAFILLAALSANDTLINSKKKIANYSEYVEGIKNLLSNREGKGYNNPFWKRLKANYNRGSNKSKDPSDKINPVLKAVKREIEIGSVKGINIAGLADEETRKIYGFTF